MHDFMPELTCVGCGPGDPELLTVKAVNAIKNADVIMCPTSKEGKPSIALSVVSSLIDQDKKPEIVHLVFPMTKDSDTLKNTWEKNSQIIAESSLTGKKVVYLTVGDPYLYSTWIYLHRELSKKYPEIKITVIPGIVSMFTFASKVGISLAEGAEKMAVIPSCYDLSKVKEIAKVVDTALDNDGQNGEMDRLDGTVTITEADDSNNIDTTVSIVSPAFTFTTLGSTGTVVTQSGLFDSDVGGSDNMFSIRDIPPVGTGLAVTNADTLSITWTITLQ